MNERKRRIGENEAVFRHVNEQIRGVSETVTPTAYTMTIVCECGTRSCTVQFEIRPQAYANVRQDSTLFLVRPGHDLPESETVIDRADDYWIVRKDPGLPAEIARATDPNR